MGYAMYTKGLYAIFTKLTVIIVAVTCLSLDSVAGEFPADSPRDIKSIRSRIRAAQFLSKATFGPTQETIDELAGRIAQVGYRRACGEWIDNQLAMPMSSQEQVATEMFTADGRQDNTQGVGMQNYRYQAWSHIALTRPDQLRQRVAWALAQIFVISDSGASFNNDDRRNLGSGEFSKADWLGMSIYQDMLASHVDGNYRDLLGDVTFNCNMGIYLSSFQNRKANVSIGRFPDENYAREIMQLFSVGLYELHQDGRLKTDENGNLIPTYDNEGIKELARLFTGFYGRHNYGGFSGARNFSEPMQIFAGEHDNNRNYAEDPSNPGQPDPNAPESKTIFGVTLSPLPNALTAEAALAEINEGLDVIANHENVPPFISRLLIQRLVKSNPSRAYLRRVTRKFRDNGRGERGDMTAVIKAILLDPEAIRGQRLLRRKAEPETGAPLRVEVVTRGTEHSRLREPMNRLIAWIRAMRPSSDWYTNDPETGEPYMMFSSYPGSVLGQTPYRAPSVFNYYLPDFQPPGDLIGYDPSGRIPREGLFAPEFQVLNGVTANTVVNLFTNYARSRRVRHGVEKFAGGSGNLTISFNLGPELELAKSNSNLDILLEQYDLLLCSGTLSETTKTAIKTAITDNSTSLNQNDERLESLLLAIVTSADCAIED
jgi:uncharacterized protein (DUF1800 family)